MVQNLVVTSQGVESGISAAFRNHIRAVEPHSMVPMVVATQHSKFLGQTRNFLSCKNPVPSNVERYPARLIQKAIYYQVTMVWV